MPNPRPDPQQFLDALKRKLSELNASPVAAAPGYVGATARDPGLYLGEGWDNPYDQTRRADVYGRVKAGEERDLATAAEGRARITPERVALQRMGQLFQREGGRVTPENRKQLMGTLTAIGKPPSADALLREPEVPAPAGQDWVRRGGKVTPIPKGTAQLGDEPYDPVAARQGDGGWSGMAGLYSAVRGSRAMETINELLADTSWVTAGPIGSLQSNLMPGTPGFDYGSKLQALGSQIAQQELAQMREASKTGGAVGQVSNFEQQMFMNALAPIQQGQSPTAMKAGLERAKESLARYQEAILLKAQGIEDREILATVYGQDVPFALPAAGGGGGSGRMIRARDPQGNIHEAPEGTPLPQGWSVVN